MGLGPQDAGYQEVIEVPMDSDHLKRVRLSVGHVRYRECSHAPQGAQRLELLRSKRPTSASNWEKNRYLGTPQA